MVLSKKKGGSSYLDNVSVHWGSWTGLLRVASLLHACQTRLISNTCSVFRSIAADRWR